MHELKAVVVLVFIWLNLCDYVFASAGDRSQFFVNCVKSCVASNCTADGYEFVDESKADPINTLLLWSCHDECQYDCMWKTTYGFLARKWAVPQFYGKWPFLRFFGIQEPASVIFSIFNFVAHYRMLRKFRRSVRKDSPMYKMWHALSAIAINAWVWSAVFHIRDIPLTELFDYTFAYSMVLGTLYMTVIRVFHKNSQFLKTLLSVIAIFYFINHFAYLSVGRFDYGYNMRANIVTGSMSTVIWIVWYIVNRKRKDYAWKIAMFVVLTFAALLLELTDFPPIFWTFDAHALWHLSTVPLTVLFYSFIIDDCKHLRKEKYQRDDEVEELLTEQEHVNNKKPN